MSNREDKEKERPKKGNHLRSDLATSTPRYVRILRYVSVTLLINSFVYSDFV